MNALCFYRRLVPFFFRPTGIDAVFKRHPVNPKLSSKRGNNKLFSLISYMNIAGQIRLLLIPCCPSTIGLKVPLGVINTIKAGVIWAFTHISKERFKCLPVA